MNNLTLEFQQMFFLVNRTTGAAVLIPSAAHAATLSGTFVSTPIPLSGVDVFIRKNGVQIKDLATLRPGAQLLPFFDYVFHTQVRARRELLGGPVPASLNARVFLSGGVLTELPALKPGAAELVWDFTRENGDVTLTQHLTDRVLFTLPLDDGSKYQLVIRSGTDEQIIDVPATGGAVVILNADAPRTQPVETKCTLTEMAILYDLTTAAAAPATYPYPVTYLPGVRGINAPICSGGQGDGDDDPPPP